MNPVASRARPFVTADVVFRRLDRLSPLGAEAAELIRNLGDLQSHVTGSELLGDRAASPRRRFLISGWAARVRWLADGRRQILGFLLPGDGVGLSLRPGPLSLCTTVALTPVKTVDAAPLLKAISGAAAPPGLAEALAVASACEEGLLLDQVMRLGRQTAYERMCHLLLEFRDRLGDVGQADHGAFPLPLTQEMIADALGLSVVHVNRILQQLRRERLLDLRLGKAALLEIDRLRMIADYQRPQPAPLRI